MREKFKIIGGLILIVLLVIMLTGVSCIVASTISKRQIENGRDAAVKNFVSGMKIQKEIQDFEELFLEIEDETALNDLKAVETQLKISSNSFNELEELVQTLRNIEEQAKVRLEEENRKLEEENRKLEEEKQKLEQEY